MVVSITTSAGTTPWSGAAFWKVVRRSSSRGRSRQLPFSWACLRFIGARPGSTASAPFATASTMPAMLIADVSDTAIAAVLGLAQPESFSAIAEEDREHPDALLLVGPFHPPGNGEESEGVDITTLRDVLEAGAWVGQANSLSPAHVHWPAIDAAAEATWQEDSAAGTRRRGDAGIVDKFAAWPDRPVVSSHVSAGRLIKQRRSCLALDGITSISAETFYAMLDRLLPRPGGPPWDVWPWPPHLHCGIFVHRVRGLPSGLYLFERSPTVHERLRSALGVDFLWKR